MTPRYRYGYVDQGWGYSSTLSEIQDMDKVQLSYSFLNVKFHIFYYCFYTKY